jgi:hypothetical protein
MLCCASGRAFAQDSRITAMPEALKIQSISDNEASELGRWMMPQSDTRQSLLTCNHTLVITPTSHTCAVAVMPR